MTDAIGVRCLTALLKPNGRVRGIAAADVYRRLVVKTLARSHQHIFRQLVSPANFGLASLSGTGRLGHLIRLFTDTSELHTVLALDGVGALHHVS